MVCCVGAYNKKLTIRHLVGPADEHNALDATDERNWRDYVQTFASCTSKGGREFWKVDQVGADVSHVWRCPWGKDLSRAGPDMRLMSEGLAYEILSVVDIDNAHQEVEIQTRRAV